MSSYSEDSLKDKLIKELDAEHCEVTVLYIYAQTKTIWVKFTDNNSHQSVSMRSWAIKNMLIFR